MPYNHRGREPRTNRLEVRLSDTELERLDQTCVRLDRTASVIVRLALDAFVDGQADNVETTSIRHPQESKGYRPSS
jgi:predicted DNA-binding protein